MTTRATLTKRLVSDIMTLYNAAAHEALKEAGVSQETINHIFLEVPHFSIVRLAKCKTLAQQIQKGDNHVESRQSATRRGSGAGRATRR
jgi:hypothetical protein